MAIHRLSKIGDEKMADDRFQVNRLQSAQRIQTATSDDARRLAEIETAIGAMPAQVKAYRAELEETGRYSEAFITTQVEKRAEEFKAQIRTHSETVTNMATRFEPTQHKIERNEDHREASRVFETYSFERRQEALAKAFGPKIDGKHESDDLILGEALLTGRHDLTDITHKLLTEATTPRDMVPDSDMQDRIIGAAKTVQFGIDKIGEST